MSALTAFIDSSAFVKLAIQEAGSSELSDYLRVAPQSAMSVIAWVEVRRALRRSDTAPAARERAITALEQPTAVELTRAVANLAAQLPPANLRSMDAIQLASAILCGATEFVTYDRRLAEAARLAGLRVASPGAEI